MRDWPRIGQDIDGSQQVPRFYTSQDIFGSQDGESPQFKYQEQHHMIMEPVKERPNRLLSSWDTAVSPPLLRHRMSGQRVSNFSEYKPIVQTQPAAISHGTFTPVDSFLRPPSQTTDDREVFYPMAESTEEFYSTRPVGKKRSRSFSEQKPNWVMKALSKLPIVGALLSSQEMTSGEQSSRVDEQQHTPLFNIQNREQPENLLRRPSVLTRGVSEPVNYPVTFSQEKEKTPTISPPPPFSLVSTFRSRSDKKTYALERDNLGVPTEEQYYWSLQKKEPTATVDNKFEGDKERQHSLNQLLRLRQQYGLSSNIGSLSNPVKKLCRENLAWETPTEASPFVAVQPQHLTRQNPFIPSSQQQIPLTSNFLRRKRGFRPLDYRRLLRQVKFHPCKWIDYFEYAKASEADQEDRLLFLKKDKKDLDLTHKKTPKKHPGQVFVEFPVSTVQKETSKKLRLSEEVKAPVEFYDQTPQIETPSVEKKRRTNNAPTPPETPWWLVNKNKPSQVPIEDNEEIFADTAKDEEDLEKKSYNEQEMKPEASQQKTPFSSSATTNSLFSNVSKTSLPSTMKKSQKEPILKTPLTSNLFSSTENAEPLFGKFSSEKQLASGISPIKSNRISMFEDEDKTKKQLFSLPVNSATTFDSKEQSLEDKNKIKTKTQETEAAKDSKILEKSSLEPATSLPMFSFVQREAPVTAPETAPAQKKLFTQPSSSWPKASEEKSSEQQAFSSSSLFSMASHVPPAETTAYSSRAPEVTADSNSMNLLGQKPTTSVSLFQPSPPASSFENNTLISTPKPQTESIEDTLSIKKPFFETSQKASNIQRNKPIASSLFDSTPVAAQQPSSIFGTSQVKAGDEKAPPLTNTLLESNQQNLFGTKQPSQPQLSPAPSLLFGNAAPTNLFSGASSQQQQTTNNTEFGSKEQPQLRSSLFGGILGADASTPKPVSIGTPSQGPTTSPTQPSLFGATTSFQPSLFGTTPLASGTSIFGTPAVNSSRPSSLFGTQSSIPQQRDMFSSSSPQQPPSLFGVKPAEAAATPQSQAQQQLNPSLGASQGISQTGSASTLLTSFTPQTQDSATARNPFAANTAGLSGSHSRRPFLRLKRTM